MSRRNDASLALDFDAAITWTVYVLCDPRVEDRVQRIRYCGITIRRIIERLQGHLQEARSGKKHTHKARWIRSLLAEGLTPTIEVVDCGAGDRLWDRNEVAWIKHYREMGCPLTNCCDGGRGLLHPTDETKARMSISHTGCKASPEARVNNSNGHKGHVVSPEARSKISAALNGRPIHPDVLARRPKSHSVEHRAKVSSSLREHWSKNRKEAPTQNAIAGILAVASDWMRTSIVTMALPMDVSAKAVSSALHRLESRGEIEHRLTKGRFEWRLKR